MSEVGERIRKVRKLKKMSQDAFVRHLGIKRGSLSTVELGRALPSDQLIKSICREYLVNEEWLKNGKGPMYPKWVEGLQKEIENTEDGSLKVGYGLVLEWCKRYHKLWEALGDGIYLLQDPSNKPGSIGIVVTLRHIADKLEGKISERLKDAVDESMTLDERVAALERRFSEIEGEKVTFDDSQKGAATSKTSRKKDKG